MRDQTSIPFVPAPARLLLRPLPLGPLSLVLRRVVEAVSRRHPGLFARLGEHGEKLFLIDPVDLPFVFHLRPRPDHPTAEAVPRERADGWNARVAGPFGALIGMLHGAFDGDALFFSGDLVIEGDTEAVIALRNALDDGEIDLVTEAAAVLGPIMVRAARVVLAAASRITGFALVRKDRWC